jgi:hypothetical protein
MGRFFSSHLSRSHHPRQISLHALVLAPAHVHVRADRGPSRMAQKKSHCPLSPLHPRQPPSPPMQALASNTWEYVSCAVVPASGAAACRASSNRGRSGGLQSEPNRRPFSTRTRRKRERTLSFSDVSSSCLISFSRASRIAYRVTARSASSIR